MEDQVEKRTFKKELFKQQLELLSEASKEISKKLSSNDPEQLAKISLAMVEVAKYIYG